MINVQEVTLNGSVSVIAVEILEPIFRAFLKALVDAAIGAGRSKRTSFLPTLKLINEFTKEQADFYLRNSFACCSLMEKAEIAAARTAKIFIFRGLFDSRIKRNGSCSVRERIVYIESLLNLFRQVIHTFARSTSSVLIKVQNH